MMTAAAIAMAAAKLEASLLSRLVMRRQSLRRQNHTGDQIVLAIVDLVKGMQPFLLGYWP
jgi:hypothetical protein